ncbi:hypothetical protein C1N80_00495 [Brachybacterium sp. SGAir0954]|nr:hypothetical protein C1N80_00495 [Brachybacterium sp. SGAir0954]
MSACPAAARIVATASSRPDQWTGRWFTSKLTIALWCVGGTDRGVHELAESARATPERCTIRTREMSIRSKAAGPRRYTAEPRR